MLCFISLTMGNSAKPCEVSSIIMQFLCQIWLSNTLNYWSLEKYLFLVFRGCRCFPKHNLRSGVLFSANGRRAKDSHEDSRTRFETEAKGSDLMWPIPILSSELLKGAQ